MSVGLAEVKRRQSNTEKMFRHKEKKEEEEADQWGRSMGNKSSSSHDRNQM